MSNIGKLKLYPNVSITKGTNKQGPIKVQKESRNYGIKGEYDIYNKKKYKSDYIWELFKKFREG